MEWWGAGMVICLERVADLHMAQLIPLPLTVFCFSKIQIGFTFLVPAHPGSPGKRATKRVCVCVCVCMVFMHMYTHTCVQVEAFSDQVAFRLLVVRFSIDLIFCRAVVFCCILLLTLLYILYSTLSA